MHNYIPSTALHEVPTLGVFLDKLCNWVNKLLTYLQDIRNVKQVPYTYYKYYMLKVFIPSTSMLHAEGIYTYYKYYMLKVCTRPPMHV